MGTNGTPCAVREGCRTVHYTLRTDAEATTPCAGPPRRPRRSLPGVVCAVISAGGVRATIVLDLFFPWLWWRRLLSAGFSVGSCFLGQRRLPILQLFEVSGLPFCRPLCLLRVSWCVHLVEFLSTARHQVDNASERSPDNRRALCGLLEGLRIHIVWVEVGILVAPRKHHRHSGTLSERSR
jgi:hypothetical protein